MTNVYKKWLKLTLKMAQCSVVNDLSFDMLEIATSSMDRKYIYRYKNNFFIYYRYISTCIYHTK